MITCSNCGYEILPNKSLCPNCGASVTYDTSWPLAPRNAFTPTSLDREKLITGKRWGDLVLGFIAAWPLLFLYLYGFALALGIYLLSRKTIPTFARGFGFGLIATLVVGLGFLIYLFSSRTFD